MTISNSGNQNKQPLVSIITPSFNQAMYLEEAINSVLAQDYSTIEHIVIDGGSSDDTLEVLMKYDDSITWVSEADSGQAEALNKGFRIANGEFIGWLNADDLYSVDAVSRAVDELQKHPNISLVHGNGEYVDSFGNITARQGIDATLEDIICVNTVMSTSAFWRRKVFEQVGYLNEELHYVLDWDYWVRIGLSGLGIKHFGGKPISRSREHSDAKTMMVKELFYKERLGLLDKIFRSFDTPSHIKSLEKKAYAGVYASGAYYYLRNGNLQKALESVRKALGEYPGLFLHFYKYYSLQNLSPLLSSFIRRAKLKSS